LTATLKRELADDRSTEARESMSPDLPGFATDRIAAIKMAARESTERDADERQGA
jgi:hypothetical protein